MTCKMQTPDARDRVYGVVDLPFEMPPIWRIPLPPPIYDQGPIGACQANVVAALVRQKYMMLGTDFAPSRLELYRDVLQREGTPFSDEGGSIRNALKAGAEGMSREQQVPYITDTLFDNISPDVELVGKILTYQKVPQQLSALKSAVLSGHPVAFGMTVYESWRRQFMLGYSGYSAAPGTRKEGLHAVYMRGYDDVSQVFEVVSSWGTRGGVEGAFKMPYSVALSADCFDFWAVLAVKPIY